jgi:uncharacterized protein
MGKSCSISGKISCLAWVLAAVGAVNWGLVGLLRFDLVQWLANLVSLPVLAQIIYILVGVCGVLVLVQKFTGCSK